MPTHTITYTVLACGLSDTGLIRENNEDAWKINVKNNVYILADGMGGHLAGEVAAQTAVSKYEELIKKKTTPSDLKKSVTEFRNLICEVNLTVHKMGRSDRELHGMGTTLCAVYFHPDAMIYGHVGDSRIYLMRKQKLRQLTEDHSLVRELIELGELTEKRARDYYQRNIITKAIGTEPTIDPSVNHIEVRAGDLILMCSDGLTDLLTQEEIEECLLSTPKLEKKAELLIKEANNRGGHDNITAVLMKIQSNEKTDLS